MTKEETIRILQSIEDRAIELPNMTECDWVAIASAKRHLSETLVESNNNVEIAKFKVGDIITNGFASVKIIDVDDTAYIVTNDEIESDANCCNCGIKISCQDNWKLC